MAPNITYTTIYNSSISAIQDSLQQQIQGFCGLPFWGSVVRIFNVSYFTKERIAPCCCIWLSLTSTKHCVAGGSGQDQKLWTGFFFTEISVRNLLQDLFLGSTKRLKRATQCPNKHLIYIICFIWFI